MYLISNYHYKYFELTSVHIFIYILILIRTRFKLLKYNNKYRLNARIEGGCMGTQLLN